MDKEKQIKQLTKKLDYCGTHDCIGESCANCRAIWLVENGYHKIDKDSVVLSKEAYIEILGKIKMFKRLRRAITRMAKEFGVEL